MSNLRDLLKPICEFDLYSHWLANNKIEVRIPINIHSEFEFRKAERFVKEYTEKETNKYDLLFRVDSYWWRTGLRFEYGPLFYMHVDRSKEAIDYAVKTLTEELENFYNYD